jgi:hypothetical protein
MRRKVVFGALVGAVLVLAAGCMNSTQEQKAYAPHINPSEFTTTIDNEYLPMKPGTTFVYKGAQSATRWPSHPIPRTNLAAKCATHSGTKAVGRTPYKVAASALP